jgi:6-phosphogluconolactonase
MSERRVLVHSSKQEMADFVAARFISKLMRLHFEQSVTHVILIGGSMGAAVLAAVNASSDRNTVDWSHVQF